jgi:hypothetical protein
MSRLILPRRKLLLGAAAALITSPAIIGRAAAQLTMTGVGGGFGGATAAADFSTVAGLADEQNIAFGSLNYTSPSITFPAGTILIFIGGDNGRAGTITSVTIKGVTATKITSASNSGLASYYASVTAGSGTVVAVNSAAWGNAGFTGGLITSSSSTPDSSVSVFTNPGHSTADTFTSVTVPTNGVGVAGIACSIGSGAFPLTWTNATRQSAMEIQANGWGIGGAKTNTAGTWAPTSLSSGGPAWAFSAPTGALVTWGP